MKSRTFWGIVLVILGAWIWLSNMGYLSFKRDWPFILIIIGAYYFIDGLKVKGKSKTNVKKVLDRVEKGEMSVDEAEQKIRGDYADN